MSETTDGVPEFTEAEYAAFASSVLGCESLSNLVRITARIDQSRMVRELGKPKCDAMWAEFKRRDAALSSEGK